ncbi:srp40-suppressor of mutant ac40 of rna polymerase i and iii [Fusarium beomiforme]|uniref:Srp40-suppressor of mutant ac40 of rna polymerase i and iii n=1 Tax=Fusarium beomiforme TaxID=44412 RepID=A0A9P5ABT6_9HYPO|nr:srp40-suppressor of mutant ac40 of rna polymerase i and iii [Fusarium beomiforme]
MPLKKFNQNTNPKGKGKANAATPRQPKVEATAPSHSMRQTRARSRLNNAPPLMEELDYRGRPVGPLPAEPDFISFNEVLRRLGGTENKANRERRTRIILHRRAAASVAGRSYQNQSSGLSSSSRPAAGSANLSPSPGPSVHSESSVDSSPAISSLPDWDQDPNSSSELSSPQSSELSTPWPSSPDPTRNSAPEPPSPAAPAHEPTPPPPLAGLSNLIPSSGTSSSSDSGVATPNSPNRTSPPQDQPSPDTLKVDMLVAMGEEQPSSDGHESHGDSRSGKPPHDDSDKDGCRSGYDPSNEVTSDDTEFTGSGSSSSYEDRDDKNNNASDGPCSGPSGSGGPRDPPSSPGLPLGAGSSGNQGGISGYDADNEIASRQEDLPAAPLSRPTGGGSDSTHTLEAEESDTEISPTLTTRQRSPTNPSTCVPEFFSPRRNGQHRRSSRPAEVILSPPYAACFGSQNDSEASDRIKEHRKAIMQTAQQAIQLESSPTSSDGYVGKRKRSCDDYDTSTTGMKRRQTSSLQPNTATSTTTITITQSSVVATEVAGHQHGVPDTAGDSPICDITYAKMATPMDDISSGELSPLVMPSFDHEIPGIYGSGLRARRHYDWYEQWHYVGYECYHVHPCKHNPGRECHDCHNEWHKAWARFFKAEDLLEEAAANPEKYLRETGLDLRKDFLGALLQGVTWETNAPHLQPPAGGKVRIHPVRLAKHRLALAQIAAQG